MTARIIATPLTFADLEPGDLWSFAGPEYWDDAMDNKRIRREHVYIRNNLLLPGHLHNYGVYRLTVEKTEAQEKMK